jgi:hypothetical protein
MGDHLARTQVKWQTVIEMYSSINAEVTEVNALADRLRARTDLLPLKARGLKRFTRELKAISEIGLPWKAVWRILRDVGYQGTYRQFVAMANRLTGKPSWCRTKTKNLPAPTAERRSQPTAAPIANQGAGQDTKPEWQIRREEAMARLDRQAEENRAREARLNRPKIFNPAPFKGRGEE